MTLAWITWSNPVSVWWACLLVVSSLNVGLWLVLQRYLQRRRFAAVVGAVRVELLLLLCGAYVFGCAFRSVLPRADVQRLCLFDTWLSSVLVGRSVATIAEVCFAIQWAILLDQLARLAGLPILRQAARAVVVLIALAEGCSWYAVITTNYLGNAIENSLWALCFSLIGIGLWSALNQFRGPLRIALGLALTGIAGYVAFLAAIDVPMYLARWNGDLANGKEQLGLFTGLWDVSSHWTVSRELRAWQDEMAWMALYFSAAVWSSLALCPFSLVLDRWPRHARAPAPPHAMQI